MVCLQSCTLHYATLVPVEENGLKSLGVKSEGLLCERSPTLVLWVPEMYNQEMKVTERKIFNATQRRRLWQSTRSKEWAVLRPPPCLGGSIKVLPLYTVSLLNLLICAVPHFLNYCGFSLKEVLISIYRSNSSPPLLPTNYLNLQGSLAYFQRTSIKILLSIQINLWETDIFIIFIFLKNCDL